MGTRSVTGPTTPHALSAPDTTQAVGLPAVATKALKVPIVSNLDIARTGLPATASAPLYQGPPGPVLQYPDDSAAPLAYRFHETAAPFANSGSAGALDLSPSAGSNTLVPGIWPETQALDCLDGNAAKHGLMSAATSKGEGSVCSISCWIKIRTFTDTGTIIQKKYANDGAWAAPFISVGMEVNGATGLITGYVSVAGVIHGCGSITLIPVNVWTLVACTYDGSNLRFYVNGVLTNTVAQTGAIDWGSHGVWQVGENSYQVTADPKVLDGLFLNPRAETVVRTAAYYLSVYNARNPH